MKVFVRTLGALVGALVLLAVLVPTSGAQASRGVNVLTQDYDIARDGANLSEVTLTPANVSSATFGKLFAFAVDEEVFAQPLYVSGLTIAGGVHNTLIVATANNSVYAFDANNPSTTNSPLWKVNLGAATPSAKYFFRSAQAKLGIVGTPVIDPSSSTIYLVAQEWNTATQTATHYLHALSLTTGADKFGGPVQIDPIGFNPVTNWQRSGLLLLNGVLYVPMASYGDLAANAATGAKTSYQGMIIAYNPTTLAQLALFSSEPNGSGAGIWQAGRGPASDGTYIYAQTANALVTGAGDLSESFVKLNPGTLTLADHFTDSNAVCMNTLDLDLSSSGPLIIPGSGTSLMLGGGKQGKVYVFQLDESLQTQTPQTFWGTTNYTALPTDGGTCTDVDGHAMNMGSISTVAFWNNSNGPLYYIFGGADNLNSYQLSGNVLTQTSSDTPSNVWPNVIALSANGSQNGILWAVSPQTQIMPIVYAYNATPSAGHLPPLWNSTQMPDRDVLGNQGRHAIPTVANGIVYVATASNQVVAYGLLPTTPAVQLSMVSPTMRATALNSVSDNIYVNSLGGFAGTVSLSVSGLPPGATYTLSKPTLTLAAGGSVRSLFTLSLSGATLPLQDNYTLIVQATTAAGVNSYAPIRFQARLGSFTAFSMLACNSSNQMSASLTYTTGGSQTPSIFIQDPTTPSFPGRLWTDVPVSGTEQTGYWIDNGKANYFYWIMDQSAGIPAIFDNALGWVNLRATYACP
jgi:hypothetical protein